MQRATRAWWRLRQAGTPGVVFAAGLGMLALGSALAVAAVATLAQDRTAPAVTGIGGVFFKVQDPQRFRAWYREHLGIDAGPNGGTFLWWEHANPDVEGRTVWSAFPATTTYFGPGPQAYMINYRVTDLRGLLARLTAAGVQQADTLEEYPYGRFAWIVDLEGNRVELWEPPTRAP